MTTYPCCPCCSHLLTEWTSGHTLPCPDPACAPQMRENGTQTACEHRANHATYLTPTMKAMRLQLVRCGCGLKRADFIHAEAN